MSQTWEICGAVRDWKDDDVVRRELLPGHDGAHVAACMGPPPQCGAILSEWGPRGNENERKAAECEPS